MKKILMICLALVMGLGMCAAAGKPAQKKEVTTVFVTDIDCEHCVKKIMNNVPSLGKGIKDVKVDLPKKEVTVIYDASKNNDENIVKGFATIKVKAEPKKAPAKKLLRRVCYRKRGSLFGRFPRFSVPGGGDAAADHEVGEQQCEKDQRDADTHCNQPFVLFRQREVRQREVRQFGAGKGEVGDSQPEVRPQRRHAGGDQRREAAGAPGRQQPRFASFAPQGLTPHPFHQPRGEACGQFRGRNLPDRAAYRITLFHSSRRLPVHIVFSGFGGAAP